MAVNENKNITMQQVFLNFFNQVQKQGLAITLLVIASFFAIRQNSELQGKVDACMQMRLNDMKTERVELMQVLNKVESALRENSRAVRRRDRDD